MESGAILLYLADKAGALRGSGKNGWQAVEWLMMQMGSVGPMLGQAHHFLRFNRGKSEYAEKLDDLDGHARHWSADGAFLAVDLETL